MQEVLKMGAEINIGKVHVGLLLLFFYVISVHRKRERRRYEVT